MTQLPRRQILAALMLAGFAVYMIWDQSFWWGDREDYSFGYLVPFFVIYVLYDRWSVIRSYLYHGDRSGDLPSMESEGKQSLVRVLEYVAMSGFCVALLMFLLGALLRSVSGPQNPVSLAIAIGFCGILLSSVFIMSREHINGEPMSLRSRLGLTFLFLFPALIWLLSAPLMAGFEKAIRVFLLTKVTIVVFNVFDILGYELQREGNILILPKGEVGVEEACSGIRSLTACLVTGSFLSAVFLTRFWKKVLLVASAMALAVITNMLRSTFLTLWAYHHGSPAIDEHWVVPLLGDIGSVHDVTGFAILGLTTLGLFMLLPIFNFQLKDFEEDSDEDLPSVEATNSVDTNCQ